MPTLHVEWTGARRAQNRPAEKTKSVQVFMLVCVSASLFPLMLLYLALLHYIVTYFLHYLVTILAYTAASTNAHAAVLLPSVVRLSN